MGSKRIILTGGGTAGHVTPNLALVPKLLEAEFDILYIGSHTGMERELVKNAGIDYRAISTGKLRRYLSVKNFTDTGRVCKGLVDAFKIIGEYRPSIIFSKGGFVGVPVVIAGKLRGVPIVIHESDMTIGLANRIAIPFAKAICTTFEVTQKKFPSDKACVTGSPIRHELFEGIKAEGLKLCGFDGKKPVLMVMGGSSGAVKINTCLRESLPLLIPMFDIIHICGKGNAVETVIGCKQFEYVSGEMCHLYAMADIIVSRAGSNSVCEIAALKKPNVLIPLSLKTSRGDQIKNAEVFMSRGFSDVIYEEDLSPQTLVVHIRDVYSNRHKYIAAMQKSSLHDGLGLIMEVILKFAE